MAATPAAPRFQLDRELGRGATSRVWHGVLLEDFGDLRAGEEVAVKYLRDAQGEASLEREAQAARSVRASGLVQALHVGRDERGPYLMMRYVPGRTLREVLEHDGPLPEPTVRSVMAQVAGGLAALHQAGYVHGDIKPENIRLDSEGAAVLVDLGFARRSGKASDGPEDEDARSAGTLLYLAPERLGGGSRSRAGDVFALGAVIYELCTGRHPFVGDLAGAPRAGSSTNPVARLVLRSSTIAGSDFAAALEGRTPTELAPVLERLREARFVPPSRFASTLSPFLDALLAELLSPRPTRRMSSAELARVAAQGEACEWWRSRIDLQAGTRRVGSLVRDEEHLTPLVGRERELQELFAALQRLRAGEGTAGEGRIEVVWLEGKSGAGKSRLAQTFASRARTSVDPPLFLYGRCHRLRDERPCQPLIRMLQRYLALPPGSAPVERDRAHLTSLLAPANAATLLQSLQPEFEGATEVAVPVALAEWLLALARETTLIVLIDDLNHADADTLRALGRVVTTAKDRAGVRLMLLLNVHGDEEARHPEILQTLRTRSRERAADQRLVLGPLDEAALKRLVEQLFGPSTPRLRLARVLWERSRGNAAFVAELLRALVQRGQARWSDEEGGLELTIAPEDLPLPGSLSRAVVESYRALPAEDRLWLQRLAVVGGRIETEFLMHAFPPAGRAEIDDALARLVRAGWLTPAGARYRFARPALRESVYRALGEPQKRRLHAEAARALTPASGEAVSVADAFQRAFHLRAAERHEELLRLIRPLLTRLMRRGLVQRVFSLARWGLEALDALPDDSRNERQRVELLEAAADAADRLGEREEQRDLLDRLSDLEITPQADPETLGRVYLLHGRYAVATGRYGLARGWLTNAEELFERAGNDELRSEALRRLAAAQHHVGELAAGSRLAERALELAVDDVQRALALLSLCAGDVLANRLDAALDRAAEAMRLLRGARERFVDGALGNVHLLRARIYRSSGRPLRALAAADRALTLARRAGERRLEAEAGARLGGLLLAVDRPVEAEERLREAWLVAEEIEDRRGQALTALWLGVLLGESDRADGRRWIERSVDLARDVGLNRVEALATAIRARFELHADDARAAASAARASEICARFGAELFDRLVIEGTRALILERTGRPREARTIERELARLVRREAERQSSDLARRRLRSAANRLLEAVASPEGPLYPRLRG